MRHGQVDAAHILGGQRTQSGGKIVRFDGESLIAARNPISCSQNPCKRGDNEWPTGQPIIPALLIGEGGKISGGLEVEAQRLEASIKTD